MSKSSHQHAAKAKNRKPAADTPPIVLVERMKHTTYALELTNTELYLANLSLMLKRKETYPKRHQQIIKCLVQVA